MHVPKEARPRECRFAIIIESSDDPYDAEITNYGLKMPTTGKIGVIVYMNIGEVKPKLETSKISTKTIRGLKMPFLRVTNKGEAHDRFESDLYAKDAKGEQFRISVSTSPILPGQKRELLFAASKEYLIDKKAIIYPIKIYGKLYSKTKTFEISETLK